MIQPAHLESSNERSRITFGEINGIIWWIEGCNLDRKVERLLWKLYFDYGLKFNCIPTAPHMYVSIPFFYGDVLFEWNRCTFSGFSLLFIHSHHSFILSPNKKKKKLWTSYPTRLARWCLTDSRIHWRVVMKMPHYALLWIISFFLFSPFLLYSFAMFFVGSLFSRHVLVHSIWFGFSFFFNFISFFFLSDVRKYVYLAFYSIPFQKKLSIRFTT